MLDLVRTVREQRGEDFEPPHPPDYFIRRYMCSMCKKHNMNCKCFEDRK